MARYRNPKKDFSPRTETQLKNKYKKDEHRINDHMRENGEATIEWFENTYRLRIQEDDEPAKKRQKLEIRSESSKEDLEDQGEHDSAGLISATGLPGK